MIDKHGEELFQKEQNPVLKLKLGCKMVQVYGGSGVWQLEAKWLDLVFALLYSEESAEQGNNARG